MAGKVKLMWPYFHSHLKSVINTLLSSGDFADVTIFCGGQRLAAHKLVLSASSPYFHSLLLENPHQKSLIMALTDTEFENFKVVIDFIYSGEAYVPEDQLPGVMDIARKFQVGDLVIQNDTDQASKGSSAMTSSERSFLSSNSQTRSETPYAQNNHNSASSHKKSRRQNPSARTPVLSKTKNFASRKVPGISDIPANTVRVSPYAAQSRHSTTSSAVRPKGKKQPFTMRGVGDPSKSLQQTPVAKKVANVFPHFEIRDLSSTEPVNSKGDTSLPSFEAAFSNR